MTSQKPTVDSIVVGIAFGQGIIFFGHWVIYQTLAFAFILADLPTRVSIRVSLAVLSVIFMATQIMTLRWRSRFLNIIYRIAAVWLGTLHLVLIGCGIFWVVAAISFRTGLEVDWMMFGLSLFALALVTSFYGIYHSFDTKVTRYDVRLPGLPEAWRGRTAVMFSDTHFGNVRGVKSCEKVVRMINAENPDIVFMPGDMFDGPLADYQAMIAPLRDIKAPLGTYFSEGNHEEFTDPTPYLEAIRAAGVKILNRDVVDIEGLQIIGLTYADSYKSSDYQEAMSQISFDKNRPSILLKHAPSVRRTVAESGISLMLCGHTHSGQMWPFNLFARQVFGRGVYGLSEKDGLQTITSSGFGTWGPPQRIGTHGEIVVIKFS